MRTERITSLVLLCTLLLAAMGGAAAAQDPGDDGPAIVGTVTDTLTGAPLPGINVHLHRVEPEVGPSGPMATATTDATGAYRFDDAGLLEQATHVGIHAGVPGYEQLWRFINWDGSLPHVMDLDLFPTSGPPAVRVRAVDVHTGEPLPLVTLFLHYAEPDESPIPFLPAEGSGADITFHRVDADRDLYLEAQAPGYLASWTDTMQWNGTETLDVEIELRPRSTDVPEDATHAAGIDWVMSTGVASGYPDGTFRPDLEVSRAQMATFLAAALDLPDGEHDFVDVAAGTTHEAAIAAIATAGITSGYPDNTFRPGSPVFRDQMATFLATALDLDPVDPDFLDVPLDHAHAGSIGAVTAAGVAQGYPDDTYRPSIPVTRGQMASLLMGAFAEE